MNVHRDPSQSSSESVPSAPSLSAAEPASAAPALPDFAKAEVLGIEAESASIDDTKTLSQRVKTVLIGKPRDLADHSVFHSLSLVAFLAWVGLGADGLSSSCYGPSEAFSTLLDSRYGNHTYLAVFLALATAGTVFVISACYGHIIEEFPSGGGGYLVASKLLGKRIGVVSGCALLVDYALTITVSIAAAGDAIFGLIGEWSLLGLTPHQTKMLFESGMILLLIMLNLRGIKESVMVLLPIFMIFLIMHTVLIGGSLIFNVTRIGETATHVVQGVSTGVADPNFGLLAMLLVFLHAYSLGAGTYTGIEAVSNSMPVMREPRVETGKRTMRYMAISLAITAGGLMLAYLILGVRPVDGKTMNQVLSETFVRDLGMSATLGSLFVLVTIVSEGCLLIVAAQAGFIDGPRVLANMARDSWVPHWFANLSERLATHNGVFLMGFAGLAALLVTGGEVSALVIMYSINVFVTFSLSMIGMCRHWYDERGKNPLWKRRLALFSFGAALCLAILSVTVYEKFGEGGYRTIGVTAACVVLCLIINRYYQTVSVKLARLNDLLSVAAPPGGLVAGEPDPKKPIAAILVGGYSGLGVHTMLNAVRFGPGQFGGMVFLSVGVVDSGNFKGAGAVEELRAHTEKSLEQYVEHAQRLGMPSASFMSIGTDAVEELEHLCVEVKKRFPRAIFFAGQLVFQRDTWYQRLLHNETAFSLQRRLQWDGVPMVILPTRVK